MVVSGEDDKTFHAMGIAKTIWTVSYFGLALFRCPFQPFAKLPGAIYYFFQIPSRCSILLISPQVISSVDSSPEILKEVQEVVIPIITFTLEHKFLGKLELFPLLRWLMNTP